MSQTRSSGSFKLRLVNVDYYLSSPIRNLDHIQSEFRDNQIKNVPVIRIFGTTETGQKACLHVHQVYPYLSVPMDQVINNKLNIMNQLQGFSEEIEAKLKRDNELKQINSYYNQFVHNIEQIKAKSFYGFHDQNKDFLRIYVNNPMSIQKISELLTTGKIFGRNIQPFEAHIPYILQFFIDHNLYGMNFIEVKNVVYRKSNNFINRQIDVMTSCAIECDAKASDILNNNKNNSQRIPGLQSIWDEISKKYPNLQSLNPLPSQDRIEMPIFDNEKYNLNKLYSVIGNLELNVSSSSNESLENVNVQPIHLPQSPSDEIDGTIDDEMSLTLENVLSQNAFQDDSSTDSSDLTLEYQIENPYSQQSNSSRNAQTQTENKQVNENRETNENGQINQQWDDYNNFHAENDIDDEQDLVDAVCDCKSDECCDHCCDRKSDQCQCDCKTCDLANSQHSNMKIPQIDGAFDDDDDNDDNDDNNDNNDLNDINDTGYKLPPFVDHSDHNDLDSKREKEEGKTKRGSSTKGSNVKGGSSGSKSSKNDLRDDCSGDEMVYTSRSTRSSRGKSNSVQNVESISKSTSKSPRNWQPKKKTPKKSSPTKRKISTPEVSQDSDEEIRKNVNTPGPKLIKKLKFIEKNSNTESTKSKNFQHNKAFGLTSDQKPDLKWKIINKTRLRIDQNQIYDIHLDQIGKELLNVEKMKHSTIKDKIEKYQQEFNYWQTEKLNLTIPKGRKSKRAIKVFYTGIFSPAKEKISLRKSNNQRKDVDDVEVDEIPIKSKQKSNLKTELKDKRPTRVKPSATATKSSARKSSILQTPKRTRQSNKKKKASLNSLEYATVDSNPILSFVQSDIVKVTDFTGRRKIKYLKSLCKETQLKIDNADDSFIKKYLNSNMSSFIFSSIQSNNRYNDYRGYLSDDDSPISCHVRMTMRNLVNEVCTVVDGLITKTEINAMDDALAEPCIDETQHGDEYDADSDSESDNQMAIQPIQHDHYYDNEVNGGKGSKIDGNEKEEDEIHGLENEQQQMNNHNENSNLEDDFNDKNNEQDEEQETNIRHIGTQAELSPENDKDDQADNEESANVEEKGNQTDSNSPQQFQQEFSSTHVQVAEPDISQDGIPQVELQFAQQSNQFNVNNIPAHQVYNSQFAQYYAQPEPAHIQVGHPPTVPYQHYSWLTSQPPQVQVQNFSSSSSTIRINPSNPAYNHFYYPNFPQLDGAFDSESEDEISETTLKNNVNEKGNECASTSKELTDSTSKGLTDSTSGSSHDNLRYEKRSFNGVVVNIDKSIPEVYLEKIGNEKLVLKKLEEIDYQTFYNKSFKISNSYSSSNSSSNLSLYSSSYGNSSQNGIDKIGTIIPFDNFDAKHFYKTDLKGRSKIRFLKSLCKPFSIELINRDNTIDDKSKLNTSDLDFLIDLSPFPSQKSVNECSYSYYDDDFIKLNLSKEIELTDSESISYYCNSQDNISKSSQIYSFYSQSSISSQKSNENYSIDDSSSNGSSQPNSQTVNSQSQRAKKLSRKRSCKSLEIIEEESVKENLKTSYRTSTPKIHNKSQSQRKRPRSCSSVLDGPTPDNTYHFEMSSLGNSNQYNSQTSEHDYQFLTLMSLEVHVATRNQLNPDPKHDNIQAIFFSVYNDFPPNSSVKLHHNGIIMTENHMQSFCVDDNESFNLIKSKGKIWIKNINDMIVELVQDELELLMKLVEIVKKFDPDIIVGYDLQSISWTYVLQRAEALNISIRIPLSRSVIENVNTNYNNNKNSQCEFIGRITLDVWRIMRKEITLNVYSYENVHYHVLHQRIPHYDYSTLTKWFGDGNQWTRWLVIEYYMIRCQGCLKLLDKLNVISKTSELARLFGIQFSEVFSRGTQFRVESMMLRITKSNNYLPITRNREQVARQRQPQFIPLVMEPLVNYTTDPVVVLDFQSLYPSMMIAYNYCYSTCLGRLEHLLRLDNREFEFGCAKFDIDKKIINKFQDHIHIAPNGVAFLKSEIRKGILPKMLEDILDTRIMVKNVMKELEKKNIDDKLFQKQLDAKQLGLKLIANVTYGYTAANFSGRMPCVEIADAIVSKGRETLEEAIRIVNEEIIDIQGEVIYGDTDSLFVRFPNCTKEEAFRRGRKIVDEVTARNPKPVKLKLEKVYMPCVIETKKHYVGFMYESEDQVEPVFEAKGIETVRRDQCQAVAKLLQKSVTMLFKNHQIENVKSYLLNQFHKILTGKISMMNDFIFAKEYRGMDSYSPNAHIPSLEIAKRRLEKDPMSEPKFKERVPYVIVHGAPDQKLIELVREPIELIKDPSLRINYDYYIERAIIPPLNRVFKHIGYNVMKWYQEMPKHKMYRRFKGPRAPTEKLKTLTQYFESKNCHICGSRAENHLCNSCLEDKPNSALIISEKIRESQLKFHAINQICQSCTAHSNFNPSSTSQLHHCVSIDCPILFRYAQTKIDFTNNKYMNEVLDWINCK